MSSLKFFFDVGVIFCIKFDYSMYIRIDFLYIWGEECIAHETGKVVHERDNLGILSVR